MEFGDAVHAGLKYKINDPETLITCLDEEPTVNESLMNAAKDLKAMDLCIFKHSVG